MTGRDKKRFDEARAAIGRLKATMAQGDNRFGSYGDNCRDSIKRWEAVIMEIAAKAN